ncbi:MAG: glycosyltransferase family 2 protein [Acidobacteriota bacterium]|nr:glycosyltransferase family 2 protein [Acidobacteriota bacterium]
MNTAQKFIHNSQLLDLVPERSSTNKRPSVGIPPKMATRHEHQGAAGDPVAQPDVSIVLVTYNRARFIRQTLESIASQTYPYFEVLICDDCSTDETQAVCAEYVQRDSRFRYLRNERNLAMPGNLNSGIRQAQCEFIAGLHDGDIYAPTLIEKWREALIQHATAGFVFNRYRHLDPEGQTRGTTAAFPELVRGDDFLTRCLADQQLQCPVWGTVMARRSVYEEMGFFDARYSFWSDVDMWFRIAEKYDVAHVPEVLIDLPHRKTMPHLFDPYKLDTHRYTFQIYWEAKRRRYRRQPLAATVELGKQTMGYSIALTARAMNKLRVAIQGGMAGRRVQPA